MPKRKKKIIVNEELAESQKLPVRIPTAKNTQWHKNKKAYNRKKEKSIPDD
jgi:hypothetical protein